MSKSLENSLLKEKEVYETYGMTETVTHIAAKKVGRTLFDFT
jgi:O-succinylbenzoic acid--CoA ligase